MPGTDPMPDNTDIDAAPGDAGMEDQRRRDVFISHASEDKDDVAAPLANALKGRGVSVWYDDFELQVGDSLTGRIDDGIASCRFGLVILSESFFAKSWPQRELRGLEMRATSGEVNLLPIWHEIPQGEVEAYSPPLADTFALSTSKYRIDEIADRIVDKIASASAGATAPTAQADSAPQPAQTDSTPQPARPARADPPGLDNLTLATGPHHQHFSGVSVTPYSDRQGRFFLDVRKDGISAGEYAGLCGDLASTRGAAGGWRARLDIGGQAFDFDNCEVTPNKTAHNRYYVDVRAFTDAPGYEQLVLALAAAAKHRS